MTIKKNDCKINKKRRLKIIKKLSVQQWIPIQKINDNGIIQTNKNKFIKIIKIIPINYNLKSNLEKQKILNSYKILLKTCNFDIQILIQSNKQDLSHHISNIQKNINKKENKNLINISKNYINFITQLNNSKNSSSKNFYLIISSEKNEIINTMDIIENDLKEKYFKIKECLSRCGNNAIEINSKEQILKILYELLNTRKFINDIFIKNN